MTVCDYDCACDNQQQRDYPSSYVYLGAGYLIVTSCPEDRRDPQTACSICGGMTFWLVPRTSVEIRSGWPRIAPKSGDRDAAAGCVLFSCGLHAVLRLLKVVEGTRDGHVVLQMCRSL